MRFRIPTGMWDAYGRICERLDRNRSSDLLDHVRTIIAEHGDAQDRAALADAEQELVERRARMHPGRPAKRDDTT